MKAGIGAAILVAGMVMAAPLQALTFVVNYNLDDMGDPNPSDGVCEIGAGTGECTVRAAIDSANHTPGGPHVVEIPYLPGESYPVWATDGLQPYVQMTIRGTGAGKPVIQGGLFLDGPLLNAGDSMTIENLELRPATVSGTGTSGLYTNSPNLVFARDLVIVPGPGTNGGSDIGIFVFGGSLNCARCEVRDGGSLGIRVSPGTADAATLSLVNSRVSNNVNTANIQGAGIRVDGGTVVIKDSLIDNNHAVGTGVNSLGSGGGIYIASNPLVDVQIINSTISGNKANHDGGGIYAQRFVRLENVTITRNWANYDDVGAGTGGGIYITDFTDVVARNSIIHGNYVPCPPGVPLCFLDGRNCDDTQGGTIGLSSYGWVMVGNDAHCPITDLSGEPNYTSSAIPHLGPLTQLGGQHPVHPINDTGAEADGGDPGGCTYTLDVGGVDTTFPLLLDQRGAPRPVDSDPNPFDGDSCDIGAYEAKCFGDDPDGDYVGSQCDVCPFDFDPLQEDSDENGVGDACEGPADAFFVSGFE